MKNIIITKNTKITLRKSGNQNKIKDSDKQNEIKNKESNPEFKMINTSNNLNYFDDSKNVDSEINSKKKNNNKQINHKYIVIKNDINIKNIKKQINNNRYLNDIKTKSIKPLKPSSSGNKNIIKKDNDKKEKTYNSAQNKSKNIGEKVQKNLHNNINFDEPKTKYKKNIYIINNINNSQQIQTKNNIYGNKINNLNINSTGNLIYDNFNEKFNKAYNLFIEVVEAYKNSPQNDIYRLALTQSFEIVYELGWKVIKDYLKGQQFKYQKFLEMDFKEIRTNCPSIIYPRK